MPVEPVLARDWDLTVNTGTDAVPVWTVIQGIKSVSASSDPQRTDDGDYDSGGWAKHTVSERSRSLTIEVNYKEDPITGVRDVGQSKLIDLSDLIGPTAKVKFRYLSPALRGWEFKASVDLPFPGGGRTDNSGFSCTLVMDGAPTLITP